jgi:hypothetical protein
MKDEFLTVCGRVLPLVQSPQGPLLSTAHPEIEPLAWLINVALEESKKELRVQLESGQDIHYKGLHAVRKASGEYFFWGEFCEASFTLPVEAVVEIVSRLDALRKASKKGEPALQFEPRGHEPPLLERQQSDSPEAPLPQPCPFANLESRAAELEQLKRRERTLENLAEESAKRRFLLADMEATGIFQPGQGLPEEYPILDGYRSAGLETARYLSSAERQRFNPGSGPEPIVGAPVSIDWFRFPSPGPSHLSSLEWLAFLENVLVHGGTSGGQGETFVQIGSEWWILYYRSDDGVHPAVVAATPSVELRH